MSKLSKSKNRNSLKSKLDKYTSLSDKGNTSELNVPLRLINKKIPENRRAGLIDKFLVENKTKIKNELVKENDEKKKNKQYLFDLFPESVGNNSESEILCENKQAEIKNMVNLNQILVNDLNKEIDQYRIPNKYNSCNSSRRAKNLDKSKNLKTKKIKNENNKEFVDDFFKTTLLFRKNTLNNFDPENVVKRTEQLKKIPYIIKCMDKRKVNSVYTQPLFDKYYISRYRKQKVNLEDILLNHNTNERRDLISAKIKPYIFYKNREPYSLPQVSSRTRSKLSESLQQTKLSN